MQVYLKKCNNSRHGDKIKFDNLALNSLSLIKNVDFLALPDFL